MRFIRNLPGFRSLCKTLKTEIISSHEIKCCQVYNIYIGTVDVLEPSTDLIHKVLEMSISQRLAGTNDLMKVSLHEFLHKITTRHVDG